MKLARLEVTTNGRFFKPKKPKDWFDYDYASKDYKKFKLVLSKCGHSKFFPEFHEVERAQCVLHCQERGVAGAIRWNLDCVLNVYVHRNLQSTPVERVPRLKPLKVLKPFLAKSRARMIFLFNNKEFVRSLVARLATSSLLKQHPDVEEICKQHPQLLCDWLDRLLGKLRREGFDELCQWLPKHHDHLSVETLGILERFSAFLGGNLNYLDNNKEFLRACITELGNDGKRRRLLNRLADAELS